MKFKFDEMERSYLKAVTSILKQAVEQPGVVPDYIRLVHKLEMKFRPEGMVVSLTRKERAALLEVLTVRANMLVKEASITEETLIVKNIMEKLKL
jgi:hypothetical protein